MDIVVCHKGRERYVILFTPERRAEALQQVGRWAADATLSLTWMDAAAMARNINAACLDCDGEEVRSSGAAEPVGNEFRGINRVAKAMERRRRGEGER